MESLQFPEQLLLSEKDKHTDETVVRKPVIKAQMNLETVRIKAAKQGHVLRYADELVLRCFKRIRLSDRMTLVKNNKRLISPTDVGGSQGKLVDNRFPHANGLLQAIKPYKSKFYLLDDQ